MHKIKHLSALILLQECLGILIRFSGELEIMNNECPACAFRQIFAVDLLQAIDRVEKLITIEEGKKKCES